MKKEKSAFGCVLSFAGQKKSKYIASVCLAAAGAAFPMCPYFVPARVIAKLLAGNRDLRGYLADCAAMAAMWLARALLHSLSTSQSHQATFAVLGNIRKQGLEKLSRMPLGDVQARGSGELKNILVERVDSMEPTLAHVIPEMSGNAVVALATLPLGMLFFMLMMAGYGKNYARMVAAAKALNDTAVEYIGGIEVIKVFGKAKSSYEKFVAAAHECAQSYIDWMNKSNFYFTFAMNVMPATLLTVLPIGGLLMKSGALAPEKFVLIVILSMGLVAPLIGCMKFTDDLAKARTIIGEVTSILTAPELPRPLEDRETPQNGTVALRGVHFGYGETEVLHGVPLFAGIGEMHVFHFNAGRFHNGARLRFGQLGHFEEFLQTLHRKFHLAHVFGEHLQLGQRADHGDGQHYSQRRKRRGDYAAIRQCQRHGQRADQRRREQREAQLHRNIRRGQPLDHKRAEIRNGLRVFLIGHARAAERLDNLDALDIFDDRAVHIGVRLVVCLEIFSADDYRQHHADHRQRERDQRSQRQPLVDAQERDDAHDRQHHMASALGDHVRQRRLQVLDLVHHHALDFADGVIFHVAQRRVQEAVGQPKPQAFQHVIRHVMGNAGGKRKRGNLHSIRQQRPQAPPRNRRRVRRSRDEQADHPIHAIERRQPRRHADHRQNHGQNQLFLFAFRIGEKRFHPALLFRFHSLPPLSMRYSDGVMPIVFLNAAANLLALS